MRKQNPAISQLEALVTDTFGRERGEVIMQSVWSEFTKLCEENSGESKALKRHTHGTVYPAIAGFRALMAHGLSREEARQVIYDSCALQAEKKADQMRMLMKIPGAYKTMPFMWRIVTKNMFGENVGFRFHFYPTGGDRVKFDMLRCPYCELCEKNGCPELVTAFCHTDDVANGNLHPKLLWNRTKTIGAGADCCDFDLIVTK